MGDERQKLERAVERVLTGKDIHVAASVALEELDWQTAGQRPDGLPHSIFEIVNHIAYWQTWAVRWLDEGKAPPIPEHAAGSWPGEAGPADHSEWDRAVESFQQGLEALLKRARESDLLAPRGKQTGLEILQAIASHNSYHLGQLVLVRHALGLWPPPSGGVTW